MAGIAFVELIDGGKAARSQGHAFRCSFHIGPERSVMSGTHEMRIRDEDADGASIKKLVAGGIMPEDHRARSARSLPSGVLPA